jgi:hypothetical protein
VQRYFPGLDIDLDDFVLVQGLSRDIRCSGLDRDRTVR